MRWRDIDPVIEAALGEDMPRGDITSESLVPPESFSAAVLLAKQDGVLAGIDVARRVFRKIDPGVRFKKLFEDGSSFCRGDVLAEIGGRSLSLLKGERTALNFLQRLSGIATKTRRFVEAAGQATKILDTRKTTPTLRLLEKYAVRMGGGHNHRFSLSDRVLIKDNHLRLVGGIREAVERARTRVGPREKIEVEVTNPAEAREAVSAGADMIMLDNMPLARMREVVREFRGRVPVEVSGGVRLGEVSRIAALGVDFISVGGLTHSYDSVDISLEFAGEGRHGRK
jgi:nicotinate-nucleotide pyrophosphorylase (carboxylating)